MRGGGSIPIVGDFVRELKIPTVMMGFGLPDDNLHAPNEKFHLSELSSGDRVDRAVAGVGGGVVQRLDDRWRSRGYVLAGGRARGWGRIRRCWTGREALVRACGRRSCGGSAARWRSLSSEAQRWRIMGGWCRMCVLAVGRWAGWRRR